MRYQKTSFSLLFSFNYIHFTSKKSVLGKEYFFCCISRAEGGHPDSSRGVSRGVLTLDGSIRQRGHLPVICNKTNPYFPKRIRQY
jgi:hypothetical protein